MEALRTRYIIENYDPVKKQLMGLPPTPAQAIDIEQLPKRPATYSLGNALTASYTWIPIFSFVVFGSRFFFMFARRLSAVDSEKQFPDRAVYADSFSRRRRYFQRGQSRGKHDALGAVENSFSVGLCRNSDCAL